jgi:hypothetical protein
VIQITGSWFFIVMAAPCSPLVFRLDPRIAEAIDANTGRVAGVEGGRDRLDPWWTARRAGRALRSDV